METQLSVAYAHVKCSNVNGRLLSKRLMFLTNFNLSEPIEQEIRLFVSSVVVYPYRII